jgi:hypothetical protein
VLVKLNTKLTHPFQANGVAFVRERERERDARVTSLNVSIGALIYLVGKRHRPDTLVVAVLVLILHPVRRVAMHQLVQMRPLLQILIKLGNKKHIDVGILQLSKLGNKSLGHCRKLPCSAISWWRESSPAGAGVAASQI